MIGIALLYCSQVWARQSGDGIAVVATANHVGLAVRDLDAEKAWYEKAFDMTVEQHFDLPAAKVRTVLLRAKNGLGIELIERQGASRPKDFSDPLDASATLGYGHWALTVGDVDTAFSRLIAVGASQVSAPGPAVQPGSRFAYVKDPEGNLIELIQLSPKK
ncbi:VOC family protein [Chitinophaga sp. Cy-1792]|nr:VOC family protein [Chitinophaga sp. Cy-1792]